MVTRKELAICKRRGHDGIPLDDSWRRSKWCGMWTRTVKTIEQREDDHPERAERLRDSRRQGEKASTKKVILNSAFPGLAVWLP